MPVGQLTEKIPLLHRLVRHHHSNLQHMKDDIGSLLSPPAPKLGPVEETKSERLAYQQIFPEKSGLWFINPLFCLNCQNNDFNLDFQTMFHKFHVSNSLVLGSERKKASGRVLLNIPWKIRPMVHHQWRQTYAGTSSWGENFRKATIRDICAIIPKTKRRISTGSKKPL